MNQRYISHDLFNELTNYIDKNGSVHTANLLSVNIGTLNRWIYEYKSIPNSYVFDINRILGKNFVVDSLTYKQKDQFFTDIHTAKYCISKSKEIIMNLNEDFSSFTLIEPSAGSGNFFNSFPAENKKIGLDIEPRCDGVIETDFLKWEPNNFDEKYIIIGNPPFGLRGNTALKFINHAYDFCEFVCFILPPLFDSDGKGSCKSRVRGYNLIHSEDVSSDFYYPDGEPVNVNVIFQIWAKNYFKKSKKIDMSHKVKIYSLSDGGTPSSTRNKKMLDCCDYYLPSTCFGEENITLYKNFSDLPNKRGYGIVMIDNSVANVIENIDWKSVAFRSTNNAYNLRSSLIIENIANKLGINLAVDEKIYKMSNQFDCFFD